MDDILGRLGKYELLRELGQGAFGTVYLARDTMLEVLRAVKVLHPALMADAVLVERFRREARLAARLEHPHIVPVHELGEAEGRFYLAMRYMEGGSLKARLAQEGRLPWPEVVRITRTLAEGLAYAHAQGVVHRDLKPSNILFDKSGRAAIGDFGFAKAFGEGAGGRSLSLSGGIVGTPAYMAPEMWGGQGIGPAADQYALACLVYEMATGEVLFDAPTPAEAVRLHIVEGPRFPAKWPEGVPEDIEAVLRRALAQDPDARYENARAFAEALEALGRAEEPRRAPRPRAQAVAKPAPRGPATTARPSSGAEARPAPPRPRRPEPRPRAPAVAKPAPRGPATTARPSSKAEARPAPPRRRRPEPRPRWVWGVVGLGALVVLCLAVLAGAWWGWQGWLTSSQLEPETPQAQPVAQWQVGSPVLSVAFSPDGTLLASGSLDKMIRLWRVSDRSLVRALKGHTGSVRGVAFSPDGTLLASGSRDKTVRLWRVADGSLVRALEGHSDGVSSVAFSPNGALLASGSWDGTVRLWRVSDGALVRTLEGHTGGVGSVAFSPDGILLAAGSGSWWEKDHTVRLWRVSDGALLRTLEGHTEWVSSVAFSPDGRLLASGSWDDTVRLWRVADGALLRTLEGHKYRVTSVAFSPEGTLLASGSYDDTVRLWRVSDGTLVRTLEGHTSSVNSVAFSPDGTLLASGSYDGTIRLWGVTEP